MSWRLGQMAAVGAAAAGMCLAAAGWQVAGPPPASWQADRVRDLEAHRQAVMRRMGPQGVLVLLAAEPRNYAGDVDWPYRQENDFDYLTETPQEGAALVLVPGAAEGRREILFLPPSDPAEEIWTGHILTAEEARRISGIRAVYDVRRLGEFLRLVAPQVGNAFDSQAEAGEPGGTAPALPEDTAEAVGAVRERSARGQTRIYLLTSGAAEYRREMAIAARLAGVSPALEVEEAGPIFARLRPYKSARELDLIRHAVEITAEAFDRAYAVAAPGMPEYAIQAQFEFTFLRRGGHWGYPCIIGSGANATTLHYETNRDTMPAGGLLLMDAAAEFAGYSADVTRTIPLSGTFSPEQAQIYRLVWEAQQAAIRQARAGHRTGAGGPDTLNGAASQVLRKGLARLGLMTDPWSDREFRVWMPHGVTHAIGLNVHDPSPAELQPGMVVTVEPGLYFRPDALDSLPDTEANRRFIAAVRPAFERYKGIGVRIEDDVRVTEGEPEVLSRAIPSRLEDVEAAMARLRELAKREGLP